MSLNKVLFKVAYSLDKIKQLDKYHNNVEILKETERLKYAIPHLQNI